MKIAEIQDKNSPLEVIKHDKCLEKDVENQSFSCKVNCKDLTIAEDEKHDNTVAMKKSTSSHLNEEEQSLDDASQKTSISNPTHQHVPNVCDDKKAEPKIAKNAITNASQPISTSNTTRVNATTSTPPAQLVVTFSTDTIGGSNSGDIRTQSRQHKYECTNHIAEDQNGEIDDRKNSCEGSYSCSCDDSCFNGGSIISQEKYTSNLDSGKTSPTCLHSNGNNISSQIALATNADIECNAAVQNGGNNKRKVAVATQTASISTSLCSSIGSPGSSDDQQSLKSTNHERTLSSVIGDYNRRPSSSSNNALFNSSSKYRLTEEPLSLMQEVPDVSL